MARVDLQDARALAQKLYGQCRDSPSSYKILTGSIRKLRNVLEEIEEALDDSQPVESSGDRLSLQVANAKLVLGKLDLALQQYKCSTHRRESATERAVADLRTHIDVTTHNLSVAFESTDRVGDIQLRLDTTMDLRMHSPRLHSGSGSASSNEHDRKLSQTSSAWSLVNCDSPDLTSATTDMEVAPSDEKEVFVESSSDLKSATQDTSTNAATLTADWRSPFAFPDPLSIPLERATSIIMGNDADLSPLRPRSSTSSTVFVRTPTTPTEDAHQPVSAHQAEQRSLNESITATTILADKDQSKDANKVDVNGKPEPEQPTTVEAATSQEVEGSISATVAAQPSVPSPPPLPLSRVSSQNHSDAQSPSPTTGKMTSDFALPKLSLVRGSPSDENLNESFETGLQDVVDTHRDEVKQSSSAVTATPAATTEETPPRLPTRAPPPPPPRPRRAKSQHQDATTSSPVAPLPQLASSADVEHSEAHHDGQADQVLKTLNQRPVSTYRITNATPSDRPPSVASFDSMYDSRTPPPGSPAALKPAPLHPHKKTPSIPSIRVDDTSLTELDPALPITSTQRARALTAPSSMGTTPTATDVSPAPTPVIEEAQESDKDVSIPTHSGSDNEAQSIPAERRTPPAIPKRPSRYNPRRTRSTVSQTSVAAMNMKEVAGDDGPEVDTRLQVTTRPTHIRHRKSVDEVLDLDTPVEGAAGQISRSVDARIRSRTDLNASQNAAAHRVLTEFYAQPDTDPGVDLDQERKALIVSFWNGSQWDQAEAYLMGFLESLIERDEVTAARRVRHLLGVCASYKGQWRRSVALFLSVMRTPIKDISDLDDGDCAAAYWLGDAYAMLNQRTEALLAYMIAERSSLFQDPAQPRLDACIGAEQAACQVGISKADFARQSAPGDSILDYNIVTQAAARLLIETAPQKTSGWTPGRAELVPGKTRAQLLLSLHTAAQQSPSFQRYQRLKLAPVFFTPNTPWPMVYDPLFAMANVQRGRLLAYECDLLDIYNNNSEAKLPKSASVGLNRSDCFTCNDLTWLIRTVRECLRTYEMEWSEVANVQGTWFVARYSFIYQKIATTHYFSISLFRQSFRSNFGVEIAPDGLCSARLVRTDYQHEKGVHLSEPKRIKKIIREFLDAAAKGRTKARKKDTSLSAANIDTTLAGAEVKRVSPAQADTPPPVPPRPDGSRRHSAVH